jgi:hypothetical protein
MEKHSRDKGKPRPLRDRASQVAGQPEPPLRSGQSDTPRHEDQPGSSPQSRQSESSQGEDQPGASPQSRQSESSQGEGVANKDRKKIRDKGAKKVEESPDVREDKPSRASFHHGSTTQAGSDYGQGSNDLPDQENRQGSESNDGANYDHEKGWKNEALRRENID